MDKFERRLSELSKEKKRIFSDNILALLSIILVSLGLLKFYLFTFNMKASFAFSLFLGVVITIVSILAVFYYFMELFGIYQRSFKRKTRNPFLLFLLSNFSHKEDLFISNISLGIVAFFFAMGVIYSGFSLATLIIITLPVILNILVVFMILFANIYICKFIFALMNRKKED